MLPNDLKPEHFTGYPPEARKLVTGYVETLQRLPLSFVPSLLKEVIEYDFKFPPERKAIEFFWPKLVPGAAITKTSAMAAAVLETLGLIIVGSVCRT